MTCEVSGSASWRKSTSENCGQSSGVSLFESGADSSSHPVTVPIASVDDEEEEKESYRS